MEIKIYVGSDKLKTNLIKFNSVNIRKSIDEICQSATINCPLSEFKKVKKHDKIFIKAVMEWNKEERAVSYILADDISATLNASEKSMSIAGRSYARDIVDSSDSGEINGGTLVQIVQKVASKYNSNIEAIHYPTKMDASPTIEYFEWENESVWQRLLTLAENNGYAIASNNISNLYVWERKTNLANNANHKLIEGVNIVSASLNRKGYEQFNKYCVKGNYEDTEKIDDTCKTKRIHTLQFTDEYISSKELETRANAELNRRKSDELTVELKGWGASDELITKNRWTNDSQVEVFYEPKQLIPVSLPSFDISTSMVVKDVSYSLSNSDFSSSLTLVSEGAL